MTVVPRIVRLFVGILCAVVLMSSLGMMLAAMVLTSKPIWVLFGFEVVIAVASVLGILFAFGRFQDGQGLTMACVSGTMAVGSFLGWLGADRHLVMSHGDVSLNSWLLGRIGAAAVLGLVGALLVLSRNARSWQYLFRSIITGGPLLVTFAGLYLGRSAASNFIGKLPGWLSGMIAVFGGILAIVLISASVHCLIRAFELGRTDQRA